MARDPHSRIKLTDEYLDGLAHPEERAKVLTVRIYDALVPELMVRIGASSLTFFVNYSDPVTKRAERERVASWGQTYSYKTAKGVPKPGPIRIAEVRTMALEALARINAIRSKNQSPVLVQRRQIAADRKALEQGKSLRKAWNEYLNSHPRLTDATSISIYQVFYHHLIDVMDLPLVDWCTPQWIEERYMLIFAGNSPGGHGGGKNVAERMIRYANMILNYADAEGSILGKNPATVAKRYLSARLQYQPVRKQSIIPSGELFRLHDKLVQMKGSEDYLATDFIELLLYTGLRDSAALSLQLSDIHTDKGFARIFFDTHLDRKIILPLSDRAIEVIEARRARLQQHQEWKSIKAADWLFSIKFKGEWKRISETKKFFARLDLPTNEQMLVRDKDRVPVKRRGVTISLRHPDSGEPIYRIASANDFRRMVATFSKNNADIPEDYVALMLTHSKRKTVTGGYIVDENDRKIREVKALFDRLAAYIDSTKEATEDQRSAPQRLTPSSLPGQRVELLPAKRNKRASKLKPTYITSSRP